MFHLGGKTTLDTENTNAATFFFGHFVLRRTLMGRRRRQHKHQHQQETPQRGRGRPPPRGARRSFPRYTQDVYDRVAAIELLFCCMYGVFCARSCKMCSDMQGVLRLVSCSRVHSLIPVLDQVSPCLRRVYIYVLVALMRLLCSGAAVRTAIRLPLFVCGAVVIRRTP